MKNEPTPRHITDSPDQEPLPESAQSTWPTPQGDGFTNPSLDRYSDLRFADKPKGHRKWVVALAAFLLLIPLIGLGFMAAIYAQARNDEARSVDAIIVLGAAQWNGRPTDVFEARLQHTLDLYNRGLAPWIIVTGGKMEGDAFTEADTAETWLINRGVPERAILKETVGNDTWENINGAWKVSRNHNIRSVLIVSDGFHLFRAERMAAKVGFEAYSSAAPESPIRPWSGTELSYVIRETIAVIVQIPKWLF